MRKYPRVSVLVLAALAVFALSGCFAAAPVEPPASSPSAAPVFASEEEALAAATEAYAAYLAVSDAVLGEGGAGPERVDEVARGSARDDALSSFESFAAKKFRSTGNTSFDRLILQGYSPGDTSPSEIVTAYVCVDISAVDVLDDTGASVVAPARPDFQAYEVAFGTKQENAAALIVSRAEAWAGSGVCA
jgi:Na+-transporting methylmalonyl-CoA/oxaloacetate decarboxylase gamma subunit